MTAEEIMSAIPLSVEETATAEEVMKMMIDQKVIRVPVVRDGKLIGLISRSDILEHMIDQHVLNVYGA